MFAWCSTGFIHALNNKVSLQVSGLHNLREAVNGKASDTHTCHVVWKSPMIPTGDKVTGTVNTSLKEMLKFSENKSVIFLPSKFMDSWILSVDPLRVQGTQPENTDGFHLLKVSTSLSVNSSFSSERDHFGEFIYSCRWRDFLRESRVSEYPKRTCLWWRCSMFVSQCKIGLFPQLYQDIIDT